MQARNNLFMVSPLIRQAIITSGALCASSDALANRLAALCEQFYLNRQIEPLTEAAELLASLPSPHARAAGNFYSAMVSFRQGDLARTARLLEATIRTEGAGKYKARAIQSLGIIYRRDGNNSEAARLYHQSVRFSEGDIVTVIRAGMTLAEIHSSEGDHLRSLDHLRALRPAIEVVARVAPVYLPLWANDVAIDLAGLGRVEEARKFAAFAVSSPFAQAWPEWLETAQEIEQARESIAAHRSILRAAVREIFPQRTKHAPRTLFLIRKLVLNTPARRCAPRTGVFRLSRPDCLAVSALVSLCNRIRAPSFILCR